MGSLAFDPDEIISRLRWPLSHGRAILFTGSGFSFGASDHAGVAIPGADALREEIWDMIWPGEPVEPNGTLKDTYAAALIEGRNRLKELLLGRLTVDPSSVTEEQRLWLSMPWRRAYTLNIDDLESAAQRHFELPRTITPVSALRGRPPIDHIENLTYIHLNGTLDDVPDTTFADPQYGRRQASTSALYEQLAADLLAYSVIFVGSQLQESLFWQFISLRDDRGPRGVTEQRPASFLVTPSIPRDRLRMLASYNIQWIKARTDEFAQHVLAHLSSEAGAGHRTIAAEVGALRSGKVVLPAVPPLLSEAGNEPSDYLFGSQPNWADIVHGRAVERTFETKLLTHEVTADGGVLVITGTAGSGTSTTMMRLAQRLSAEDRDVRFVSADHSFTALELGRHLRSHQDPIVVFLDDADTFGRGLRDLVKDVANDYPHVLLVIGIRASRVDTLMPDWRPDGQTRREVSVPLLDDSDIASLLDALEADNKLGALKRLTHAQRVEKVRTVCGRELLVAMIEATSGEKFQVKAIQEYEEMEPEQRLIYGIAAIASEQRFALAKDEMLIASDDLSNTGLYALDRLTSRRFLIPERGGYVVRHRRIAELVVQGMRNSGELQTPYRGLLRTLASRYRHERRSDRDTKLVTTLMSHTRMARLFTVADARSIYDEIEDFARDDYHYWLQRGSLEVQDGNLNLARNWLQQAFDGGENDRMVQTEWSYYLLKSAWRDPGAEDAEEKVRQARETLLQLIETHGATDTYPWHIYGSQMLQWIRRAPMSDEQRATELEAVKRLVDEAVRLFPRAQDLRSLQVELKQAWLMTAVPRHLRDD